ncbi:hypothetical protein NA57DRAFT_79510 [Rhizodiscina lignyota]|uniref:Cyclochlorotine biosynthesis protein O n=1 Tax=Rhizodiscina lignyota TaxID=1504668 RepID=A0A9P4M2W0_9PEZI|nr:hypothetical protein NA57DRAFT_79510 [Rhizodiscina lignyota]
MLLAKSIAGYTSIQDEEEPIDTPGEQHEHRTGSRITEILTSRSYLCFIHGALITTCFIVALQWFWKASLQCFDAFVDVPIVWEEKTLQTPFQFSTGTFDDSWGGSSPEADAKWDELLSIASVIRLTESEARRLPIETAHLWGEDKDSYAGFLEVYHQLHCLNRIRRHFYNRTAEMHGDPTPEFSLNHDEHCFDYLRQNLMCFADVSILPQSWNPETKAIYASFDTTVKKKCRSFEAISQWAISRQPHIIPPGNSAGHG